MFGQSTDLVKSSTYVVKVVISRKRCNVKTRDVVTTD